MKEIIETATGNHQGTQYTLRARGQRRRWQVDCTFAEGIRIRTSTKTKDLELAHQRARNVIDDALASRGFGDSKPWTLDRALTQTIAVRWARTRGEMVAVLNAKDVVNFLGSHTLVRDVSTSRVDALVSHLLRRGLSGATVNRKLAALSAMLRVAHERGQIIATPFMRRQRERKGRLRWFNAAEEEAILQALREQGKQDIADLVVFLLDTGMRRGEAFRIRVQDVDLDRNIVHIWETKSDIPRTLPLTPRVRSVVLGRVHNTRSEKSLVWRDITIAALTYAWNQVRRNFGKSDDPDYVLHALRHTCASRLVQRGVPLAVVQHWLGHASVTTTMRYAHLSPDSLDCAVLALSKAGQAR
jgi:integrase